MKVSTRSDGPGTRRRDFRRALLEWYGPRARRLRIRLTRDPWAILVSEVMAQQTQISRVDAAWEVFMRRYPTPAALAEATTADVLRAWAGLGYNRRALNLQRAATTITLEHGGRVPDQIEELVALPGVGPYTARAVAAIAFGRPVAAVDTNVRRVVTRVIGRALPPAQLQEEADALVDVSDPATWTHASMELGALVCVARAPRCEVCPVAAWCASAGRVRTPPRQSRSPEAAFELTTRWLRGRIVERLRALDDGRWERLPQAIGAHGEAEIEAAAEALAREGLLQRRHDGAVRLPSD
jgi:A/G-specific adenine glycosylase